MASSSSSPSGSTSPFRLDLLKGRSALVSGGGSGINLGIVRAFAQHGARVAIMGRRKEVLEKACREVERDFPGAQTLAIQGDVRDYAACEAAVGRVVEAWGGIDILLNGAAGNFLSAAQDLTSNGFKTVMEIDVLGTFNLSRAAFSTLSKAKARIGDAVIINITATLDKLHMHYQIHASAAKQAIESMTRSMAAEWGHLGIRSVAIAPGAIDGTEGFDRLGGFAMKDKSRAAGSIIPIGRLGSVQDIANCALYLASSAGNYVTGEVIVVDGGQCIYAPPVVTHEELKAITARLKAPKSKL